MTEKNFFKEKLYHHTLPVHEGLWQSLEAQLPPEETQKRFPVFWITLFGTALLGGALMIGLFTQPSKTVPSTPAPVPGNEVITSSPIIDHVSEEADLTGDSALSSDANDASSSNTTTPAESITESTVSNNLTEKAALKSGTGKTSTQQKTNQQKSNQTGSASTASALQQASGIIAPATSTTDLASSATTVQDIAADRSSDDEASMLPYRNMTTTSLLPMADMNAATALDMMAGIAPDPNCYKFGDIGPHYAFSVDILGGPGFSPKTYEKNGGETADYIQAREDTEKHQYGWSLGARLNLHHRSGLTARLGLQYTQVGDVFDYTDSLATQSTTRIDSFFAADGTFLYTEVTQVLIDGTLVKKIHNTYRYLDIPLLIGYEMRLGRNIVALNAGPVFNLTHTYEGQILDSMLHPRSITPGKPGAIDIYKTNVGMSIYLGAGLLFPLSDRLSALVEPSYLFRLKAVTLNSYELKEKRGYAGLNLGLRYHIN